jgi:ElaB/YqjD/DUF883 family membrane-anchored ribosome-binding protein
MVKKEITMSHAHAPHAAAGTIGSDNDAIKEKAVAAKDAVVELAGEAKKYAVHRASDAKETAAEWVDTAKSKLGDANDTVIEYIQRNPFKAVAIAVGVGFVAGLLLKRR